MRGETLRDLAAGTGGAKVAKSGETLVVTVDDRKVATARLGETSQVVLMGSVYVTPPACTS